MRRGGDLHLSQGRDRQVTVGVGLLILVAVVALGCGAGAPFAERDDSSASAPSRQQAQGILVQAGQLARSGDVDALCKLGYVEAMCRRHFTMFGGRGAAPKQPPVDLITRGYLEQSGVSSDRGGYVLVLRGEDGLGCSFEHHFAVFYDENGDLKAKDPVYWTGIHGEQTAGIPTTAAQPVDRGC